MVEPVMSGPIVPEQTAILNGIAVLLHDGLNPCEEPTIGFCILTFPFAHEGQAIPEWRINYISNGGDRKDMAKLFRQMADNFEREIDPPTETRQ